MFCIDEPVTFVDSSSGGYFVSGSGPFACDTTNAIAWEVEPATGFTLVSGTLGSIPVDYFDSTTHGTNPACCRISLSNVNIQLIFIK